MRGALRVPFVGLSLVGLSLVGLSGGPRRVRAHPLAPLGLTLREVGEGVEVELKRSRIMPPAASFAVRRPPGCEVLDAQTRPGATYVVQRQRLRCPGSLVGLRFGVDGLSEAGVDAVVRAELADGRVFRALLAESTDGFTIPARRPGATLLLAFLRSGVAHLWTGLDHLLFVVGLALLLGAPRRVLWGLTAFTVGHGLSMCAAVLGWVALPTALAEAAIAATLLGLAWEIARRRPGEEASMRRPYLGALAVGLVHGLGFAAVFSDAGLGGADLWTALGAFHLGIEAGQLGVVLAALLLLHLGRRHQRSLAQFAAHGIGIVASYWLFERLLML